MIIIQSNTDECSGGAWARLDEIGYGMILNDWTYLSIKGDSGMVTAMIWRRNQMWGMTCLEENAPNASEGEEGKGET